MEEQLAYCLVSCAPIRSAKKDQSEIISQLLFGETVRVIEIDLPWAKVITDLDNYEGYIDYKHVNSLSSEEVREWKNEARYFNGFISQILSSEGQQWIYRGSLLPESDEFTIGSNNYKVISKPNSNLKSAWEYAEEYVNTPYLWGGKNPFGIDCSGITQVIYRFFNVELPRDASQQVNVGRDIKYEDHQINDLAYFSNSAGKVTHVGILDGDGKIIHASGHVRKDDFTKEGIYRSDTGILTHKLTCIKRV